MTILLTKTAVVSWLIENWWLILIAIGALIILSLIFKFKTIILFPFKIIWLVIKKIYSLFSGGFKAIKEAKDEKHKPRE